MRLNIAITDRDWFDFLSERADKLDEVNFWQPTGPRPTTREHYLAPALRRGSTESPASRMAC